MTTTWIGASRGVEDAVVRGDRLQATALAAVTERRSGGGIDGHMAELAGPPMCAAIDLTAHHDAEPDQPGERLPMPLSRWTTMH